MVMSETEIDRQEDGKETIYRREREDSKGREKTSGHNGRKGMGALESKTDRGARGGAKELLNGGTAIDDSFLELTRYVSSEPCEGSGEEETNHTDPIATDRDHSKGKVL